MALLIGIDLGGTKIAGAIYDTLSMAILQRAVIPTEAHLKPDAVLQRIADHCRTLCQNQGIALDDIQAVGVGIPGTLNYQTGQIMLITNLPGDWWEKPAADILGNALGRPVFLVNDARAFTLAEATLGAGRGAGTVFGVTLGTGIGGGIAINGRLHLGLDGSAGEFGNHTVDVFGMTDGSGTPGGLESFCSGPAIAAMGAKAVMQGMDTSIGVLVDHDLNRITPAVIMQAAENGDAYAQEILNRGGMYLGAGIANVVSILAPDCIVIGGGLAKLGEWLFKPMRAGIQRYNHTVIFNHLKILPAELGDDAGIIGAAVWAGQQIS